MKKDLIKTPIINEKDFHLLNLEKEAEYKKIIKEIELFCSFFTRELNQFINVPNKPETP